MENAGLGDSVGTDVKAIDIYPDVSHKILHHFEVGIGRTCVDEGGGVAGLFLGGQPGEGLPPGRSNPIGGGLGSHPEHLRVRPYASRRAPSPPHWAGAFRAVGNVLTFALTIVQGIGPIACAPAASCCPCQMLVLQVLVGVGRKGRRSGLPGPLVAPSLAGELLRLPLPFAVPSRGRPAELPPS